MRSVCVFSGSNSGARPVYLSAAQALGRELARREICVVYGGARVGLMGAVADSALAAGGTVVGVIPRGLAKEEIAHTNLSELHLTDSMHERKAMMAARSDAFVALPGGYGTLEEFVEALTWSQLGLHQKPCGLLDVAGFFSQLLTFLDHAVLEGFLRSEHRSMILTAVEPGSLLDEMTRWQPVAVSKWTDNSELGPLRSSPRLSPRSDHSTQ